MSNEPSPPRTRRSRRRGLHRLLLAAVTAVVGLIAAELLLHALDLYPPMPDVYPGERPSRAHPSFIADPLVGWRMRPDVQFEVTAGGRTVHYAADAHGRRIGTVPAGERERLVVLAGDSFFWGADVEFADSLAAHLARQYPTARIANLAQPGFGVDQMMLAVVHQGLPLRPDLVIVGIYPHDLSRSHTAFRDDLGFEKPTFRLAGGKLAPLTAADRPAAPLAFLEQRSRVFGLWRRALRNVGFEHGVGPWWTLNEAILDELRRTVAAAGARLLVVHIPLHDWRPFGALAAWAARHSVPLVDPVRIDPVEPAGLYFAPEGHFTPRGHRYVADLIGAWIARDGPPALR